MSISNQIALKLKFHKIIRKNSRKIPILLDSKKKWKIDPRLRHTGLVDYILGKKIRPDKALREINAIGLNSSLFLEFFHKNPKIEKC